MCSKYVGGTKILGKLGALDERFSSPAAGCQFGLRSAKWGYEFITIDVTFELRFGSVVVVCVL
jgi:hypothetical protein